MIIVLEYHDAERYIWNTERGRSWRLPERGEKKKVMGQPKTTEAPSEKKRGGLG